MAHAQKTSFFNENDLASYRKDGFILVKNMYTPQEAQEMSDWIDELKGRPPEVGKLMAYYEDSLLKKGEKVLSRIEKFTDYHQGFHKMVHEERMLGRTNELLGEKALLFKEKINFKLSGGGGFEPHQDIQPGWDDYAPFFISVLVTIDPSTEENGCLELAAGHHTNGMLGEKWKPLTEEQLKGIEFVKYPTEPGDVVFFDCFVPHQSQPNLTDKPRRNVYLTYNRTSEGNHRQKYFADKRKSFPPDFEREQDKKYVYRV